MTVHESAGSTEARTSPHAALLRSVAAFGLAGSTLEWPGEALDDRGWDSLVRGVGEQRLWGLLGAAVESGALPSTQAQARAARELKVSSMQQSVLLERELVEVLRVLTGAGVEHRLLKGPAAARLDYREPSLRCFADIDLLVPPLRFDDAVAALVAAGLRRRFPEPRPGFDRRFSKGASFTTPRGYEIDLHRTFVMGPFGLSVQLDDLWDGGTPLEIGGLHPVALTTECRFLHACYHAALGNIEARLVPLRDVASMLLEGDLDVARVRALMTAWKAEPVVALAVDTAWRAFELADVVALSAWAARYVPDERARRQLAVYHDEGGGYAEKSFAAVAAVPGLRNKVRFAAALAFPQESYLEGRDRGSRRLGRVVRAALRVRSGA